MTVKVGKSSWSGGVVTGYRVFEVTSRTSDRPDKVFYAKRRYSDFVHLFNILSAYNLTCVIPPLPPKSAANLVQANDSIFV
jgi:hypothetical protein